jgi:hypothetical protein
MADLARSVAGVTAQGRQALLVLRARRTAPAGRTPGPFTSAPGSSAVTPMARLALFRRSMVRCSSPAPPTVRLLPCASRGLAIGPETGCTIGQPGPGYDPGETEPGVVTCNSSHAVTAPRRRRWPELELDVPAGICTAAVTPEPADPLLPVTAARRRRERPRGGPPARGRSPFGGHLGDQRGSCHTAETATRRVAMVRPYVARHHAPSGR